MGKVKKPYLSIVIPCLNEAPTIQAAVKDALRNAKTYLKNGFEVIVADNGSTDGTLQILKRLKNIKVIHVPIRGYGAALHWGILEAKGKYILFGDADLSYPFSNLDRFLPLLEKQKPDLLLGSRLKGEIEKEAMPWSHRYLGTPILTLLIRLLYGIPTSDCNSGMRIVKKNFYRTLNMRNSGMEWASELLLKTALKKGVYAETPIEFLRDQRNRPPHLSRWADGWRHLKTIILLKPLVLGLVMIMSLILAVLIYPHSFALFSLFAMIFVVLLFSLLALKFLEFAIEGKHNSVSLLLNSSMLVPWIIMTVTALGGIILLLPENRLGTKMLIIGIIAQLLIWTFLIETVKTHLINRLNDLH